MKITMQGIAEMAGVSLATVSRTVHSPHLVREKTRGHVLQVMRENRYIYHAAAADLSRNRSSVIGVIIPTTKGAVFANSTLAIQEKAQERGFSVLIGNTRYDTEIEAELLQRFQEHRLAGVILTGFSIGQEDRIKDLIQTGIPCLVIWETLSDSQLSYVGFDNFVAAYSVTEYLIGLGHERIGLILGPFSKIGRARKRLEGYQAALAKASVIYDPKLVIEKHPTLFDGKEAMKELLALGDRPSAVFAASDMLAIGALAAARERGLQVPQDISIAGFDDIDFAAYCNPPLTTVRVPAHEMGELAVTTLLEMIVGNSQGPRHIHLATELVLRQSCQKLET